MRRNSIGQVGPYQTEKHFKVKFFIDPAGVYFDTEGNSNKKELQKNTQFA